MPETELTDEALAKALADGNKHALEELVFRYQPKLMRYGRKFLADNADIEDKVQDVFLKVYQNIRSFDTTRSFSPWIYRIAHNVFVTKLRDQGRSPLVFLDLDTLVGRAAKEDVLEEGKRTEMRSIVEAGLERLPVLYREVLVLFYLEELGYREIADVLRVPVGTVGIRLKRGKELLKQDPLLKRYYES